MGNFSIQIRAGKGTVASAKNGSKAGDALAAYRQQVISTDTESKIAALAAAVKTYEDNKTDRDKREAELAARQTADEDSVLDAFDSAKAAGAKPSVLAAIGLRPETALAAARGRRKTTTDEDDAVAAPGHRANDGDQASVQPQPPHDHDAVDQSPAVAS